MLVAADTLRTSPIDGVNTSLVKWSMLRHACANSSVGPCKPCTIIYNKQVSKMQHSILFSVLLASLRGAICGKMVFIDLPSDNPSRST